MSINRQDEIKVCDVQEWCSVLRTASVHKTYPATAADIIPVPYHRWPRASIGHSLVCSTPKSFKHGSCETWTHATMALTLLLCPACLNSKHLTVEHHFHQKTVHNSCSSTAGGLITSSYSFKNMSGVGTTIYISL